MPHQDKRATSVDRRAANVAQVISTCNLSGLQPSPLMKSLFARYEMGEITSTEVISAVLTKYGQPRT